MNVAYINPFIAATRNVFDMMIHVPLALGSVHLKAPDERLSQLYKISAIIGLSGAASGLFVLNLSQRLALALASGLAGQEMTHLNADCLDALGEIANMIAGNAKKDFPGGQINLSPPRVIKAEGVSYPPKLPVITIPYDTTHGRLLMEISFQETCIMKPSHA